MNKIRAVVTLALLVLLSACGASNDSNTSAELPNTTPEASTVSPPSTAQPATALPTLQPTATIELATVVPPTAVASTGEHVCASVTPIQSTSAQAEAARDAVQTKFRAEPTFKQIVGSGDWLIAQATFEQAEPGVFLLRRVGDSDEIEAAWGGVVEYNGQIQQYFAQQAPAAPKALLDCFEPQEPFAR